MFGVSNLIRSTTLMTLIFVLGRNFFRISLALMVSSVGVSPQQAKTRDGDVVLSLMNVSSPIPFSQCFIASSIVKYCGLGCFEAMITFI